MNARLREGYSLSEEFTGNSGAINQVRATLKRVANTGSRVLITGPAGSGKEVAARLLHAWSPRAEKAFVTVNSARITPERFEQELFGEEADGKLMRAGLLEMADGGTLYFDEVADMPINTQARILRVLTDQSFVRAGGNRQIGVDVRVVSSTARDLEKEIEEKRFREDLFYRLNVVPVSLPSLADRRDDIPALADHFFTRYAREQGLRAPEVSPEALAALQAYDWPGNVRQLRNVVERTVILAPRDRMERIEPDMLPSEITGGSGGNGTGISSLMGVPLREARVDTLQRRLQKKPPTVSAGGGSVRPGGSTRGAGLNAARSERLENPRCAHAGADAHGHHAVLLLAAPQPMDDGGRPHRARRAQRVAQRNGAAQRVHLGRVEVGITDDRQRLGRECLVEFDPVELVLCEAGLLQRLWNGGNRADAHDFGAHARHGEADEACERRQAVVLDGLPGRQQDRARAIAHL